MSRRRPPAWRRALAGRPITPRTVKAAARAQVRQPPTNPLSAILRGKTSWTVASHGKPTVPTGRGQRAPEQEAECVCPCECGAREVTA